MQVTVPGPYQSWGDNENPYAEIMIEFGRQVEVEKAKILLRADFPHDNYWEKGTLLFSDGSFEYLHFTRTKEIQSFCFPKRVASWVKLKNLQKDNTDPSPFPALTQWEIWGKEYRQ